MTEIANEVTQNTYLPTQLQQYIHLSRYARWLDKENRRETWPETVNRYVDFFSEKYPSVFPADEVRESILTLKTMPSMRALMTAGPALARDHAASFNCSYLAIDHPRAFDEALYILMCFHPETLVVTKRGNVCIKDVMAGDEVRSFDEVTHQFKWCKVTSQVKTPSASKPKVEVLLDNGEKILCTADHQWLTSNRSWVEAQHLTPEDDLVYPSHVIYKATHLETGKSYVGLTSQVVNERLKEHHYQAFARDSQLPFHRALRSHGKDSFKIETIDVAYSLEEASLKEREWIEKSGSLAPNGYNCSGGGIGTGGLKWTEKQRQKASENSYERTENHRENQRQVLAKNFEKINQTRKTEAYREKQRQRNLGEKNPRFGKVHSLEWKEKLSARNSGNNNPFFGKRHTEETKKKIKVAHLQRGLQKQEQEGVAA